MDGDVGDLSSNAILNPTFHDVEIKLVSFKNLPLTHLPNLHCTIHWLPTRHYCVTAYHTGTYVSGGV